MSSPVTAKGRVGGEPKAAEVPCMLCKITEFGEPGGPEERRHGGFAQSASLGKDLDYFVALRKVRNCGAVGLEADAEIRAAHPGYGGVGLYHKMGLTRLEKFVDQHIGQALEDLDHRLILLGRIVHELIDGQTTLRGQGDDAVVNQGIWALDKDLLRKTSPVANSAPSCRRRRRKLTALREVHPPCTSVRRPTIAPGPLPAASIPKPKPEL